MSYAIYVGSNHTADGIAWLAGYGDEPSSHWLEIVPHRHHAPDARITVGVTQDAELPGRLSEIAQVAETARHIRVSYSYYKGVPAPLTNGGLNEHGVAVRDVWSPSRQELIDRTPKDQTGPNYSDLARMVIERARTAREGVEIIGELIASHGYSTYGGNSHLIADCDEAWVVIECAGGARLWAAERLGVDSIRASRPGYIGQIPVDDPGHSDFLYAPDLVSFAVDHGWYRSGEPFDFNTVYGDGKRRWAGVQWIEAELARRAALPEKIMLTDIIWALRTPKLTGDTAGYGQIVPLLGPDRTGLRYLWHTQIGAIAAPFVPVFLGAREVPEEFRQHRYLSNNEAARFIDLRHADAGETERASVVPQGIESTRSASAIFKRLLYLILEQHERFLPEVTEIWEGFERQLIERRSGMAKAAEVLLNAGAPESAADLLTYFTDTELRRALDLAETLAASLEVRTRALGGINTDAMPRGPKQIW